MEKFYRYQGTNQVEQCSYYVDVELLYEDVQELKRLNNTISKEQLRDELYWKYEKTLELRRDIQAETLFQKVCEATSWNEVWTISENILFAESLGIDKRKLRRIINGRI